MQYHEQDRHQNSPISSPIRVRQRSPNSSSSTSSSKSLVERDSAEIGHLKTMLEDLQAEFDAFRESSAELESELEEELERVEGRARNAEELLQQARENHEHTAERLTHQLLEAHKELEVLREHRRQSTEAVRTQEEALEQTAEKERRAQAEASALREALDNTMEQATISQTELEELKRTSEATTRHLYEDLEEVQLELAMLTPIKALLTPMKECMDASTTCNDNNKTRTNDAYANNAAGEDGGDEDHSGAYNGSAQKAGRGTRHFFTMASMEEDSKLEMENDTPRVTSDGSNGSGAAGAEGRGVGGGLSTVSPSAMPASPGFFKNEEASRLQQELERQLKLSAAETAHTQVFNSNSTSVATPITIANFKHSSSSSNDDDDHNRGLSSSPPPTLRWGTVDAIPHPSPAGALGCGIPCNSLSDEIGNTEGGDCNSRPFSDHCGGAADAAAACPRFNGKIPSRETETTVVPVISPTRRTSRGSNKGGTRELRMGGKGRDGRNRRDSSTVDVAVAPLAGRGSGRSVTRDGGVFSSGSRERHGRGVGGDVDGEGSNGLREFMEALANWKPFACCGGVGTS